MNASLLRQGKLLEYATLGWNIIGVFVLILAIRSSRSLALIGFGFDTLLEIGASIIVIWELNGIGGKRQKIALTLLSLSFFLLGIYILVQSLSNFILHFQPTQSSVGIVWLLLTFIVMIGLAFKKFRVGKLLNNPVLLTEGRVTLVDAGLACVVLISILSAQYFGWWWADIAGSIVLMGYCFWEAIHIWRELKT
jgi:divalent metal cation (Fe/Co/Zn/Cd) transporter